MRIFDMSVSFSRTINLGNFNNVKIGGSLSAQLEEGDDPAACYRAMREMIRTQTAQEAQRLDLKVQIPVDWVDGIPDDLAPNGHGRVCDLSVNGLIPTP